MSAFVALVVLLALDALWISANMSSYRSMVERVQRLPMRIQYIGAVLSYACIYLALVLIAFPAIRASAAGRKQTPTGLLWLSVRHAGLLGLLIYGVFNFTNMALFANYDVKVAVKDTVWGATLLTATAWVTFTLVRLRQKA